MEDNRNYKSFESGTNPTDSDLGAKDIYFAEEDFAKEIRESKKKKNAQAAADGAVAAEKKKLVKKSGVVSTYLFFIIVIAISMVLSIYAVFCLNDILGITKSKSSVTVNYTEDIESTSDAIDLLYDYGLINCPNFCKLFASVEKVLLSDAPIDGPYLAGVYYLYGKMGLEGMLNTMCGEQETTETVTITIAEGKTVPDIIELLVANEVCDKASLLAVIESTQFSYSLVADLEAKETVPYRLEGFLFPDTYEFYVGMSASGTISKFLQNLESKITEEYRERAEEMGYSMYEIITIASIIQAEAGSTEQMATIASVIENRLNDRANYPSLGCQSTSDYINNDVEPALSSTSQHTSEYYLTYYNTNSNSTVVGLPEGPICNPGLDAIEAALYPEDTDYYYFFHDASGKLYTASTYSEFKSLIATYAPYLSY
ncbi:MAG: endolytic transglycosylase MltG [Clostridiales bacterium]|nr:endolytic transglycosylase MltG [Clostridiales bacterium]